MEFDILMYEYEQFDCVLQFGGVRCDVTSENSRRMYESTPFCLANNKVLDLGKYYEFDQKLIGYVSLIHSSAIWTEIVLPLRSYFKYHIRFVFPVQSMLLVWETPKARRVVKLRRRDCCHSWTDSDL